MSEYVCLRVCACLHICKVAFKSFVCACVRVCKSVRASEYVPVFAYLCSSSLIPRTHMDASPYQLIYLSSYPSTCSYQSDIKYLSIYLSIYRFFHPTIYLSINLFIYLCIYPFPCIELSTYVWIHGYMHTCICATTDSIDLPDRWIEGRSMDLCVHMHTACLFRNHVSMCTYALEFLNIYTQILFFT